MKTKYNWSSLPAAAQAITTNQDQEVRVWLSKKVKLESRHFTINEDDEIWWLANSLAGKYELIFGEDGSKHGIQPFAGDWRDSLEMRPEATTECDWQCKGYKHPDKVLFLQCRDCARQNDAGHLPPLLVKWVNRVCPEVVSK